MKKLIFMAALMVSCAAAAQDNRNLNEKAAAQPTVQAQSHMTMKDGKMWVTHNGKTAVMDKDMTLSNGTVVTTAGKITNSSGKTMTLGNGEMVDMNGDRVSQMTREPKM